MEDVMEIILNKISSLAMEGILFEVSATPKPGLVDRNNAGAHKDMDYFTFMSSAAALHDTFDIFVRLGWEYRNEPIESLLQSLRCVGVKAEHRMFAFTNGVNTHKGMIFTLGILCGCAGWAIGKMPLSTVNLSRLAARMCKGICMREYTDLEHKTTLTKGERMYLKYGCTGVRGEVEQGYPTVIQILPIYSKLRSVDICINDALVQTLLHLIADTCDTNILSRHDMQTALFARQCAKEALRLGGIFTEQGKESIENMDQVFIERYISPGGCADLLAVTHFIYSIENSELLKYNILIGSQSEYVEV